MQVKFKNPYVYLKLEDGSEIHVKLEDEGVVVDRWVKDKVKETTYKLYQEMIDGDEDKKEEDTTLYHIYGKHGILGEAGASDLTEKRMKEVKGNMMHAGYTNIEVLTMDEYNKK